MLPLDAILLINYLNDIGFGPVVDNGNAPKFFYDTSADNYLAPLDAILVINTLNEKPSGEGESDRTVNGLAPLGSMSGSNLFSWSPVFLENSFPTMITVAAGNVPSTAVASQTISERPMVMAQLIDSALADRLFDLDRIALTALRQGRHESGPTARDSIFADEHDLTSVLEEQ